MIKWLSVLAINQGKSKHYKACLSGKVKCQKHIVKLEVEKSFLFIQEKLYIFISVHQNDYSTNLKGSKLS